MSAPVSFETHALGRSVRLGELYNAYKSQFLGVQMYEESKIQDAISPSPLRNSKVFVKTINSFTDKSSLIDINASLTIDILGGIVNVEGSAAYLNDVKATAQESAWAMYSKVRTTKKMLLFAQERLGNNALEWVKKQYIATGIATHFVSSIDYGGDVIVTFTTQSSSTDEKESISGHLKASVDKLAGVVNIGGEGMVEVEASFSKIKDKYEVFLNGDITVDTVPTDPKGVLQVFQDANKLMGELGVPILVTLEPIPPKLIDQSIVIHNIETVLLRELVKEFGRLDDADSRFQVLQKAIKGYEYFAPDLSAIIHREFSIFKSNHRSLVGRLASFVDKFLASGLPPEPGTTIRSAAESLANEHDEVHDYQAPKYPATLAGLEQAYANLQDLLADNKVHLNDIGDVNKGATTNPEIALFLMSSLHGPSINERQQFSEFVRTGSTVYSTRKPPVPMYFVYVENLDILKDLPNPEQFVELDTPAHFLGTNKDDGKVSWSRVKLADLKAQKAFMLYDINIGLVWDPSEDPYVFQELRALNSSGSFTITVTAYCYEFPLGKISLLALTDEAKAPKVDIELNGTVPDVLVLMTGSWVSIAGYNKKPVGAKDVTFSVAFVQNISTKTWLLYVNGEWIGERQITEDFSWGEPCIAVGRKVNNGIGLIKDVKVFANALTQSEILQATNPPKPPV